MYRDLTILGLIPARGGSRRLPGKNVAPLAGKPMIAWTIEAARRSRHIDRLVLSSDDAEIIAAGRAYGCDAPFVRPADLATAEASSLDVALHALSMEPAMPDVLVLLQPTSPLRETRDIDACIELCLDRGATSAIAVSPLGKPTIAVGELDGDGRFAAMAPNSPGVVSAPAYAINGAVYVVRTEVLRQRRTFFDQDTLAYAMPRERACDVDEADDFAVAEQALLTLRPAMREPAA